MFPNGHSRWITSIHTVESDKIVTTSADGAIVIWKGLKNGVLEIVKKVQVHSGIITRSYRTDNILITCSSDKTTRAFDLHKYMVILTVDGHEKQVYDSTISANKQFIVTSDGAGQLSLWKLNTIDADNFYKACAGTDLFCNDIVLTIYEMLAGHKKIN